MSKIAKIKKEVTKKPKAKKETPSAVKLEAKVNLISFTVGATIPTMMYGNITPSITVEAPTIEEAKNFVMPVIEELYQKYVGPAQDGKMPVFINKANVTAVEKKVEVPAKTAPTPPVEKPKTTAQESADDLAAELAKSPAYTKAENAVKNCTSIEALGLIEDQIQKSVKLTGEEKPLLLTEVLKKRKEFAL